MAPMFTATVGTGEEHILRVQGDRADRPFNDVRIDLDTAVVEEPRKTFPTGERVADEIETRQFDGRQDARTEVSRNSSNVDAILPTADVSFDHI